MTRNSMLDFGAELTLVTVAFFVRNAAVLGGLSAWMIVAFLN